MLYTYMWIGGGEGVRWPHSQASLGVVLVYKGMVQKILHTSHAIYLPLTPSPFAKPGSTPAHNIVIHCALMHYYSSTRNLSLVNEVQDFLIHHLSWFTASINQNIVVKLTDKSLLKVSILVYKVIDYLNHSLDTKFSRPDLRCYRSGTSLVQWHLDKLHVVG